MSTQKFSSFSSTDVEILDSQTIYHGYSPLLKYKVRFRLFSGAWSNTMEREVYARRHAAAVLLYDPRLDQIVLVEQFRIGLLQQDASPWLLETVAGVIEDDAHAEQTAKREAKEEAGLLVQALEPIANFWASPGYTQEKVFLFCGKVDAANAGGIHGLAEENENIRVHVIASTTAFDLVATQQIQDPKAIISLQWLRLHKAKIQAQWQSDKE